LRLSDTQQGANGTRYVEYKSRTEGHRENQSCAHSTEFCQTQVEPYRKHEEYKAKLGQGFNPCLVSNQSEWRCVRPYQQSG